MSLHLLKYYRPHNKSLPIIESPPPEKSPHPGRQFTGKNPLCPGGRQAGRIFVGKLSAGGRLFWGDPIMERRGSAGAVYSNWGHPSGVPSSAFQPRRGRPCVVTSRFHWSLQDRVPGNALSTGLDASLACNKLRTAVSSVQTACPVAVPQL